MAQSPGSEGPPTPTGPTPTGATPTDTKPTGKKKRGRESAGDMVRSLTLVLAFVGVIWFLAQPPDSDKQAFREVDPGPAVTAFQRQAPGALVPVDPPAGWRSNVAEVSGDPVRLRVGYVLPEETYVEYVGVLGADPKTIESLTGTPRPEGSVQIDGASWERYRDDDGSLSLVRPAAGAGEVTVIVGSTRATASEDDLRRLIDRLVARG